MSMFGLDRHLVFITGAGGLLGRRLTSACLRAGARVVAIDNNREHLEQLVDENHHTGLVPTLADITDEDDILRTIAVHMGNESESLGLVNNAAINPMVEKSEANFCRLENLDLDQWNLEVAVGLTGALLMTRVIGREMARRGVGSIVNVSSDHGLIAPDQRLYGGPDSDYVKPVSYSVVKHGVIGLTKWTATYWAHKGVRANTLCPGGIHNNQNREFVDRFQERVPMGRMASADEYSGAVIFLLSGASSYMTGATLTIDGGRSTW